MNFNEGESSNGFESRHPASVFQWNAALSPLGGTRFCTLNEHAGHSSLVLKIHKDFKSQYSFLLGLYGHQSGGMSETITSEQRCFAADGGFLHFVFFPTSVLFYIHCRSRFCFHACKNLDNKCICKTTDVLLLSPRFQMVKKNHICWGLETSGRPSVSISSSSISDYMEMGHEEPNQSYNICAALFPIQKSLVVY